MKRRLLVIFLLALSLAAPVSAEQVKEAPTPTPASTTVDLVYDNVTIEVDPADGPVQCLTVWRQGETTDLTGVVAPAKVRAIIIADDVGNGFIVSAVIQEDAIGLWNLQPGDACGNALASVMKNG